MKQLALEIRDFLDKYARISADFNSQFDNEEEKFNSPDASMLLYAAKCLENGVKPELYIHSDWSSGGYTPYISKEGRELHDSLLKRISEISKVNI